MEYTVNLGKESLRKIADAISGGVEIEPLEVTENGEYTAPDGKAYSPVSVNVAGGGIETATVGISGTFSGILGPSVGHLPIIDSDDEEGSEYSIAMLVILGRSVREYNVILHNGVCYMNTISNNYTSVSATGDIEISGALIIIRGSGTLTFTA